MPPTRDSIDKFIASLGRQDWGRLRARLLRFALHVTQSRYEAEDVLQEALRLGLEPGGTLWDPAVEPELARHLFRIIKRVADAQRMRAAVRTEPRNVATVVQLFETGTTTPEHDKLLAESDARTEWLIAETKRRLDGDALAVALVNLSCEGVRTPAAQATTLKKTIEEIRNGRRRMKTVIDALVAEERQRPSDPYLQETS